ncbi:hypothetical protein [Oceanobacillus bengalensis]|nr:hypothetical protein [Oceanobacillus bengalensis]
MKSVKNDLNYDGSEMDEVKSPPLLMIITILGFLGLGFIYIFTWAQLLSP